MNTLVKSLEPKISSLQFLDETASLIKASIAENTQKAYQSALQSLRHGYLVRTLSDAFLASYITTSHEAGKSPATIGQVVAAVKWQLKNQSNAPIQPMPITQTTSAGIRKKEGIEDVGR